MIDFKTLNIRINDTHNEGDIREFIHNLSNNDRNICEHLTCK